MLAQLVGGSPLTQRFSFSDTQSSVDVVILGCWFMTREIELSAASAEHLTLTGEEVSLMLPCHKSESRGDLTVRSFRCACRARAQPLCPFHAAERHQRRLTNQFGTLANGLPLVPTEDGQPHTKSEMVQGFREVISAAGIPLTRKD